MKKSKTYRIDGTIVKRVKELIENNKKKNILFPISETDVVQVALSEYLDKCEKNK